MPVVTTHYRVVVTAGRHRQPRNVNSWIEPNSAEVGTHIANTPDTPTPLALLPYLADGANKLATFLFWSTTDHASVGETSPNLHYTTTIGTNDTEITAWYLPPGGIGNGGPGYLVDTFSVMAGDFVNDTVFSVFDDSNAENAALTTEAKVVGIVDTVNRERLETLNALPSSGEAFEHWITNAVLGEVQPVVAGGPFTQRIVRAATVAAQGDQFAGAQELTKLALGEVLDATKQLQAHLEATSQR